jgi:hypothetical protein
MLTNFSPTELLIASQQGLVSIELGDSNAVIAFLCNVVMYAFALETQTKLQKLLLLCDVLACRIMRANSTLISFQLNSGRQIKKQRKNPLFETSCI